MQRTMSAGSRSRVQLEARSHSARFGDSRSRSSAVRNFKKAYFTAVYQEDIDQLRYLYDRGVPAHVTDEHGQTALMLCANNPEMTNFLLDMGINVNAKSHSEKTALHFACTQQNVEVVKRLIRAGADLESRDQDGETPLHVAIQQAGCDASEHRMLVTFLLDAGADILALDGQYTSTLCMAIAFDNSDLVDLFLTRGMEAERLTRYHATPLYEACILGAEDIVGVMIRHNVDVNACNDVMGSSAFRVAALGRKLRICEMLLAAGANMDEETTGDCRRIKVKWVDGPPEDDTLQWLREQIEGVKRLSHLCRHRIRSCLTRNLQNEVESLGLPKSLKEFLLIYN